MNYSGTIIDYLKHKNELTKSIIFTIYMQFYDYCFIFISIEGMILQTRNSSSKLVKKDSSSSIRYPLPLKRFASVKSNFQTNSSNRSKLSLNVLSEIQEKEHSISDETRNQLSAIKAADNSHVRLFTVNLSLCK